MAVNRIVVNERKSKGILIPRIEGDTRVMAQWSEFRMLWFGLRVLWSDFVWLGVG